MTQVFAYWRVSIEAQDVASQRCGVVLYCSDKKTTCAGVRGAHGQRAQGLAREPAGPLGAAVGVGDVIRA